MKKVAEVLEGLREEERRLAVELSGVRRAIAALEEVMGLGPPEVAVQIPIPAPVQPEETLPAGVVADAQPEAAPGPYAFLSFYEAAAAWLAEVAEPKNAKEIASALLAGGYVTSARDFTATVRTMLNRDVSAEPFGIYATKTGARWFARMPDADESKPSAAV